LTSQELQTLASRGFRLVETIVASNAVFVLGVPQGTSASRGLSLLRDMAPVALADLDHYYQFVAGPADCTQGACGASFVRPVSAAEDCGKSAPVGLIAASADSAPPSSDATMSRPDAQAPGTRWATVHGRPSADAVSLLRSLAALSQDGARVVDIGLVGPPNALVGQAVRTAIDNRITIVAVTRPDAPSYPAAYDDVIAVTDRSKQRTSVDRAVAAASTVTAAAALVLGTHPDYTPGEVRLTLTSALGGVGKSANGDAAGRDLLQQAGLCEQQPAEMREAGDGGERSLPSIATEIAVDLRPPRGGR
jgi:hypothetical protein